MKKTKKLLSLLLCAVIALGLVPFAALEAKAAELPTATQFATVDDLKQFDTDDTDGQNPAKVYFGKDNQQWWIAGEEDGNIVLFGASPLATRQMFEETQSQSKTYDEAWKCDYTSNGGTNPSAVNPNHYGASPLRTTLQDLEASYFTTAEQSLMNDTTVYTEDTANTTTYSTTNKLYLAQYNVSSTTVTVGASDSLRIDSNYWDKSGDFWLRTARSVLWNYAYGVSQDNKVSAFGSTRECSVVPAFELDSSSVLFASAVLPVSSETASISRETFTLRYRTNTLGIAVFSADKSEVNLSGVPSGAYLVAQNSDGAYAKQITDETSVSASEMRLDSFANCKVWLETTDTANRMTYAALATTVFPKADTPEVDISKTATSITATVKNHKTEFGDIEYKWDNGDFKKDKNTLSNLQADTTHTLAVRFKGNGFYQTSEEYRMEKITTLKDGSTVIQVPVNLTATYKEGLKLSEVALPAGSGWSWVNGDTSLSTGTNAYPAAFDTTDLESTTDFSGVEGYDAATHKVTRNIEVTVNPGDETDNPQKPDGTTNTGGSGQGGNKPNSNGGQSQSNTTAPQTGDNSSMALWIALMFLSLAGVGGTVWYSRKKKAVK